MAEKQVYTFTNEIDEVEISSLGAKIFVESTDDNAIVAEYDNPNDKPELCAVLCGKHLTIKENLTFQLFCKRSDDYRITLHLPKKLYKELKIKTASGGVEIDDDQLAAERFTLNTASGVINVRAFFENVKVKSASGCVHIVNVSDKTAQSLSVNTVSGKIVAENYRAERFSINSVSGETNYTGAVGEGSIGVTSGKIDVSYDEWNSDLKVSAVSGTVNVKLPGNSGVDVQFDGVSGIVKTDLGGEQGKFMNLGKGTNGEFGGENKHKVSVSLVSGIVTLSQKPQTQVKETL